MGSIFQCCGRLVKPHGGGRRHFFVDRSLYIAVNIAPQQLHGSKRADDVHLSLKTPGSQDLEIWASSVFWSVRKLAHLAHMVSRASTLPAARYRNLKSGQHESCARNSCADSAHGPRLRKRGHFGRDLTNSGPLSQDRVAPVP